MPTIVRRASKISADIVIPHVADGPRAPAQDFGLRYCLKD